MEAHEYANIFPMLSPEKLSELADDIKENGLLDPIIRYQGKILDGRNRLLACEQSGIRPRFDEFGGDDDAALSFVMSKNLKRRHLTTGEAAMIGARYATLKHGTNQYKVDRSADRPSTSNAEAAAMVEVSEKSIRRAKKVIKDGVPALEEMVKANKIKVRTAATIAALPKAEQDELCARGVDALKKKASEIQAEDKKKKADSKASQSDATPRPSSRRREPPPSTTQIDYGEQIAMQAISMISQLRDDDKTALAGLTQIRDYCNNRISNITTEQQ